MNRCAALPRNDSYLQNDIHAGGLLSIPYLLNGTTNEIAGSLENALAGNLKIVKPKSRIDITPNDGSPRVGLPKKITKAQRPHRDRKGLSCSNSVQSALGPVCHTLLHTPPQSSASLIKTTLLQGFTQSFCNGLQ